MAFSAEGFGLVGWVSIFAGSSSYLAPAVSLFQRLSIQLKACRLPVLPYLIMLPHTWLFVCLSNCRACSQLWSSKLQSVVTRPARWPCTSVYCINRWHSLGQTDLELGSTEFHIKSVLAPHFQLGTDSHADWPAHTCCTLAGLLIMHSEANAMKMMDQGRPGQKSQRRLRVIGLCTTFVQTTKCLSAKRALDPVHALLGVSHSWWALEIASFLSRWRRAGPSSLTSHSGVARLQGLCRVQQAKYEGSASFIFSSWYHSVLLCNPPVTLTPWKETLLFCRQTEFWKLRFSSDGGG